MFIFQILVIVVLSILYCLMMFLFCRRFVKEFSLPIMLVLPFIIFSTGFIFRLSGNKLVIDVGYFATESASVFLYALFTGALVLGQLKFWKK